MRQIFLNWAFVLFCCNDFSKLNSEQRAGLDYRVTTKLLKLQIWPIFQLPQHNWEYFLCLGKEPELEAFSPRLCRSDRARQPLWRLQGPGLVASSDPPGVPPRRPLPSMIEMPSTYNQSSNQGDQTGTYVAIAATSNASESSGILKQFVADYFQRQSQTHLTRNTTGSRLGWKKEFPNSNLTPHTKDEAHIS